MKDKILVVENISKEYTVKKNYFIKENPLKALDDVNFFVNRGETLGLVGESGSGKSTIGKLITRLQYPTKGKIFFEGKNIYDYSEKEFRKKRKDIQMIFQESSYSLDPKMLIQDILKQTIKLHINTNKKSIDMKINNLLEEVGLPASVKSKFPPELSGGQKQRVSIAKAISIQPEFIFCDEPVSSLDVSVQSKILNLLMDIQKRRNITYLFVAHGLNVVKHVSDRVIVLYRGKIMEIGKTKDIYDNPFNPYTKALISSFSDFSNEPTKKSKPIILKGELYESYNNSKGCVFFNRCYKAKEYCGENKPELEDLRNGRLCACHYKEVNIEKV
ncbi:MAG: ABC transporter ATP-binding protein [Bacillota bacterium]|nr:ABC transporter ATP-binding protein [Bacillota bacterium]MDW7667321.1 ABC transporter ATP-binding protein [Bacillota bacterium]